MGENKEPRPSNVTRPIQAGKAKGIEKIFEVAINENEEKKCGYNTYENGSYNGSKAKVK